MTHYSEQTRNNAFIGIATTILIVVLIFQFSSLHTHSYAINRENIFKIDSVKMLSKAFLLTGRNSEGIEFEDENRKTFSISETTYDAAPDKFKLYDTLQYSELVMSVFTDKDGLDNYRNKDNRDKIEVYNMQIGETSFIDLNRINKKEVDNRRSTIIFISGAYCIALINFFRQRKKLGKV